MEIALNEREKLMTNAAGGWAYQKFDGKHGTKYFPSLSAFARFYIEHRLQKSKLQVTLDGLAICIEAITHELQTATSMQEVVEILDCILGPIEKEKQPKQLQTRIVSDGDDG